MFSPTNPIWREQHSLMIYPFGMRGENGISISHLAQQLREILFAGFILGKELENQQIGARQLKSNKIGGFRG